jgi:hypothetical protein
MMNGHGMSKKMKTRMCTVVPPRKNILLPRRVRKGKVRVKEVR